MLDNWEVDPVGLNGGEGIEIEGYQVNLQVTASLDRGKKRQDKDSVEEMYGRAEPDGGPCEPRCTHHLGGAISSGSFGERRGEQHAK